MSDVAAPRRGLSDEAIGALSAIVVVVLVLAIETGMVSRIFNPPGPRTVQARFTDAHQLAIGDPVRIRGVNVGRVEAIALDHGSALVTLKLENGAGPLYADAGAQLRFRTLLGGDLYVDLTRGSDTAARLGSRTIPMARTGTQVELDDVTSVVSGQAKLGLQRLAPALATALSDPRYPARPLQALADRAPVLAGGLKVVRGQQPDDVTTLIDTADTTARALDAPDQELRRLVGGTASLLRATGARSADLARTIQTAPSLLSHAEQTMASLDGTLHAVNPLLTRLQASAPEVAPTARGLRATVAPATVLLRRATPLLHALRPAVSSLAAASDQAGPLLDRLSPSLTELADRILPYLSLVQPDTKHSFAQMIGPAMAGLGAMGAYEDNEGRFARFPATGGSQSFYLPCQADFNPSQTQQLLACATIGQALGQAFGASTGPTR